MAKTPTLIFSVILMLLGILGFTSNSLIGANALFVADSAQNLIHLILGAILLVVALWASDSLAFWLKVIGAVLFLLGLIGLITVPSVGGSLLGIAASNGASDWLHLILGATIYITGMYGISPTQSLRPQGMM